MKKLLFGIFICFGLIFVMSDNVDALDFVLDLDNYAFQQTVRQSFECAFDTALTFNSVANYCDLNGTNNNLSAIRIPAKTYTSGDIISFDIVLNYNGYSFTTGETVSGYFTQPFQPPQIASSNDYYVLDIQQLYFDDSEHLINYYNEYFCRAQGTGTDCQGYPELTQSGAYYQAFRVYLKAKRDLRNTQLTILGSSYSLLTFNGYNIGQNYVRAFVYRYNIYSRVNTKEEEAAQKELESTDNIENQTPPSSSETGDGAQATNLINAFGGFVSALGGLSATNCNLTLNFPEFAGGSRVVNVCQNKDKAGNIISVFSSLTLIVFYVPLAIRLLTMIYNEIRSFTNG